MKKSFLFFSILLAISILFISCKKEVKQDKNIADNELLHDNLPVDFVQFYTKFLSDSTFQVNRISFPLDGLPADADSIHVADGYQWQEKDWRIHKPLDPDDDYFQASFRVFSKDLVFEYIFSSDQAFFLERRYAKHSDGWQLIYFQDVQMRGGIN